VSGIDVRQPRVVDDLAAEIKARIGLRRLRCLHVNDTHDELGSNRDVHVNIGQGRLRGRLGVLLSHAAFRDLPAILETPGRDGKGPDVAEMRKLRRLYARAGVPIARGTTTDKRRRTQPA
jgi:deoxyribonuclease-4